jgi:hypothetical protein
MFTYAWRRLKERLSVTLASKSRPRARSRFRPALETLEDRLVLSTLRVVPANVPVDATHFHSAQDALNSLGPVPPPSVIQIEPNSQPGGLVAASLLGSATLTVQGDPLYKPSGLPQLGPVQTSIANFTLTNLNLSSVTVVMPNMTPSPQTIIQNCTVVNVTDDHSQGQMQVNNDTITGSVSIEGTYTNDVVYNCTFQHSATATPLMLQVIDGASANIQTNQFTSSAANDTGILIDAGSSVGVSDNTITLSGGGAATTGIRVESTDGSCRGTSLDSNTIQTSTTAGYGIYTTKGAGNELKVTLRNNDLEKNLVGLLVEGDGTNLGTIDAGDPGGKEQDSAGGNNFDGFTNTNNGRAAIKTLNATTGTVTACQDLWSVSDPSTVVAPAPGTTILTDVLLYVVPAATNGDATHFHTLAAAFAATTLASIIQIEPNSAPGGLDAVNTLNNTLIIVRGDPKDQPSSLPTIGAVTIENGGVTFLNLKLTTVDNFFVSGSAYILIQNCAVGSVKCVQQNGGYTLLNDDTITGNVLLVGGAGQDSVLVCTFQHTAASTPVMLQIMNANGGQTLVYANQFTSSLPDDTAIEIDGCDEPLTDVVVENNTITLTAGTAHDVGIRVATDHVGPVDAWLKDNTIVTSTGAGIGIATVKDDVGMDLNVTVSGNDLSKNHIGLQVTGDGTNLGTVAAGTLINPGGNHFESFTNTANGRAAITTLNATTGVVNAYLNIWGVAFPNTVNVAAAGTKIETGIDFVLKPGIWALIDSLSINLAQQIEVGDDGQGDVSFAFNGGDAVHFHGIHRVMIDTGASDTTLTYSLLPPPMHASKSAPIYRPAGLSLHLGSGQNIIHLQGPTTAQGHPHWSIAITSASARDLIDMHFGTVAVDLTVKADFSQAART